MQTVAIDRNAVAEWYAKNRARTRALFDMVAGTAYYSRPIALRNPIVFYEGHLPAFSIIAFLNRGLGREGVDRDFEQLFARGIDPESEQDAVPRSGAETKWPPREEVLGFAQRTDTFFSDALSNAPLDTPRALEGLFTALEHEAMHQETLLYMWQRLPFAQKTRPTYLPYEVKAAVPSSAVVRIPAGRATLGARRDAMAFGWDNEFEAHTVEVDPFEVDVHSVTNADYLPFVEAGHAEPPSFWIREGDRWCWRGMFENIPLPPSWPVYVSYEHASAYAAWKGRRLLTEPEYHRAAYGTPTGEERVHPWGSAPPDRTRGHFDFGSWTPVPAGSRPAGASAWGVHDLVGNGWEWTSTVFGPFDGFTPMASYPEYSVDFFDGQHYVLKGASPATAKELIRRSFRNWFRPNYPYVFAKFRTARSL
jgi:formylglycine-generating enzyme required for sulfatase activity